MGRRIALLAAMFLRSKAVRRAAIAAIWSFGLCGQAVLASGQADRSPDEIDLLIIDEFTKLQVQVRADLITAAREYS